jgi:hypothetical protein
MVWNAALSSMSFCACAAKSHVSSLQQHSRTGGDRHRVERLLHLHEQRTEVCHGNF